MWDVTTLWGGDITVESPVVDVFDVKTLINCSRLEELVIWE